MDIDKIKQMVEDGFAAKRIAKILEYKEQEVRDVIAANGFTLKLEIIQTDKTKKTKVSDEHINRIVNLYKAGVSAKMLAVKFGIDKRRVQAWAKEQNLLRSREDTHRFNELNEHALDNINTLEAAYWLGFLYADAYHHEGLYMLRLALARHDRAHIEQFAEFMGCDPSDVTDYEQEYRDKTYQCSRLTVYSKYLSNQLLKLGCPQAKSFTLQFPIWLQPECIVPFIRGYFDGDGCIKMHNDTKEWCIRVCGTQSMIDTMIEILQAQGIKAPKTYWSQTNNDTYIFEISGNQQITRFCEWLYRYSTPETRLARKYDRFLMLKAQQDARAFKKQAYRISNDELDEIKRALRLGVKTGDISADKHLHPRTVTKIKSQMKDEL